ncbi:GNAT family N-acetyltransferase [Kitasatospora sp. GAS1066B]|uniref:GNAT family N-acetyltransferase n=1 Tax=Kitasatospora sp. GAS1066B TaxID=3156271 RepID=UPI003516E036
MDRPVDRPVVTLRKITLDDWPAVHSWAGLDEACRYQAWGPNTEEQTRAFVEVAAAGWAQDDQRRFSYLACLADEVVGMGELHIRSRSQRQGEISYVVAPRAWGRGVGTAIGRQLLTRGFGELGLHRIYATCDPRNLASARVLRKLGMSHEGRHRHTALIRDGWRDSEVFAILETEHG